MTKTFKESYKRLEEIANELDSNEIIDVDELIKLQDEAKKLHKFCETKLKKLDKKIENN